MSQSSGAGSWSMASVTGTKSLEDWARAASGNGAVDSNSANRTRRLASRSKNTTGSGLDIKGTPKPEVPTAADNEGDNRDQTMPYLGVPVDDTLLHDERDPPHDRSGHPERFGGTRRGSASSQRSTPPPTASAALRSPAECSSIRSTRGFPEPSRPKPAASGHVGSPR